jgi:Protein of unknown function (DUF1566)
MGFFKKIISNRKKMKIRELFGFIEYNDGTIEDPILRLMWQKDDDGIQRNYPESLDYCEKVTTGGYLDWRLPRRDELLNIAKVKFDNLKLIFPNIQQERYWAFTTLDEVIWAGDAKNEIAYTIDFDPLHGNYGQEVTYFKKYKYYVKAVRKS